MSIGLTLIIAVVGLSQLDIGHLGKHGFELIGLASSDWNHLAVVLFTVLHFLCILSALLALIVVILYSNADTSLAVIVNCTTTHIHLPKSK